ncbi:MAG: hypothetical protein V4657_03885 [Pseudomonadota bacterium]
MLSTSQTDQLIQQARDIVADKYLEIELARGVKPSNQDTFASWGRHLDDYTQFLREGAYDNDLAVVATLAALTSVLQASA